MSIIINGSTTLAAPTLVGPVQPLLLDTYTNASTAYSITRKLNTSYSGNAIKVRRSSDNVEANIGFDTNGNLNESALLSFIGANSGFVSTIYDQSGNGRDAVQTTNSFQPQIVSSGSIIKQNNKPSMLFDGINDRLTITNNEFSTATQVSFICVDSPASNQASDTLGFFRLSCGDSATRFFALGNNTGLLSGEKITFAWYDASTNGRLGASTYNFNSGNLYLEWLNVLTNSTVIFQNGNSVIINLTSGITTTTNNTPNAASSGNTITIGGFISSGSFITGASGYVSEWILWLNTNSKLSSRFGIENNINLYYNIY